MDDILDVSHLRDICRRVGIPVTASDPKVQAIAKVLQRLPGIGKTTVDIGQNESP